MTENKVDLKKNNDGAIQLSCTGYDADEVIRFIVALSGGEILPPSVKTKEDPKFIKKNNKEAVVEYDLAKIERAPLPRSSSDFKCRSCGQAILIKLFEGSDDSACLYAYRLIGVERPVIKELFVDGFDAKFINDDGTLNKDQIIETYAAVLEIPAKPENITLIGESGSNAECPICGDVASVSEWIEAHSKYMDGECLNTCGVCGEAAEMSVDSEGYSSSCENNCLKKLKEIKSKK